ncbi:MAG: DUF5606 domain-containing protein [Bacteroidaceae bacterium]|nr:DUF5606 domain-containing protein [Bacteroidaceae bacterium]
MLNKILTVTGRPGLYKLVARGRQSIIVESVDDLKKRSTVQGDGKAVSLGNISIYTDDGELGLREVFKRISSKHDGKVLDITPSKMNDDGLRKLLAEYVSDFDRDRVHPSHIKKIFNWYNLLVANGFNNFEEEKSEDTEKSESATSEKE